MRKRVLTGAHHKRSSYEPDALQSFQSSWSMYKTKSSACKLGSHIVCSEEGGEEGFGPSSS